MTVRKINEMPTTGMEIVKGHGWHESLLRITPQYDAADYDGLFPLLPTFQEPYVNVSFRATRVMERPWMTANETAS